MRLAAPSLHYITGAQPLFMPCKAIQMFLLSDIEDMTHKTGNYKQFHVFINMLESAISQVCSSYVMIYYH